MTLAANRTPAIAGAAVLTTAALLALFPEPAASAYLAAYLLIAGFPLGATALLMLLHVTGGGWARRVRRLLENASMATPMVGVALVAIVPLAARLYPWAAQRDPEYPLYFHPGFVAARALVIVLLWSVGGPLLARASRVVPLNARAPARLRAACSAGLILYALSMTGAAADWFGSTQAGWHSSIFAVILMCSQVLSALALVTLWATAWGRGLSRPLMVDLGNFLLALAILHAYVAFSQFFIIWNGNVPERTVWYVPRTRGLWLAVVVVVAFTQFAAPTGALLFRRVKQSRGALLAVTAVILAGSVLEAAWIIMPGAAPSGAAAPALFLLIAALLGAAVYSVGTLLAQRRERRAAP